MQITKWHFGSADSNINWADVKSECICAWNDSDSEFGW